VAFAQTDFEVTESYQGYPGLSWRCRAMLACAVGSATVSRVVSQCVPVAIGRLAEASVMLANFEDGELRGGHCVIGVTGGTARLDHVRNQRDHSDPARILDLGLHQRRFQGEYRLASG
jgi:hypothetical protein